MSLWSVIVADHDAILAIAAGLAGLLGVDRWRTKAKAATAQQVDRLATTVAAGVVLAIRSGAFRSHETAMAEALGKLRTLAVTAGVAIGPLDEARAVATFHKMFVAAGQLALVAEAEKLHRLAEASIAHLAALPWPAKARR